MTDPAQTDHLIDHMVVVVPAHDEADDIQATIEHLSHAADHVADVVSTKLIVVADGCTDRTASLAAGTGKVTVIESSPRCVGLARRIGTEYGLGNARSHSENIWLAFTDADTVVPRDWLRRHLDLAGTGVVGVAGIVALASEMTHSTLRARFERYYSLARDGTHKHVHGANLGVRADAYLSAGGWSPLSTGEDHDLWDRLRRVGPVISPTSLVVQTSARLCGRAPDGFANDLRVLAAS